MVMIAECNWATGFSSSYQHQPLEAVSTHLQLLPVGLGWHRGDFSTLLQAPRRAAWAAQLDPSPMNHRASVYWGRLDSWELWDKPPLDQRVVLQPNSVLLLAEMPVASKRLRRRVDGHSATQQSKVSTFFLPPTRITLNWRWKFPRATLASCSVQNSSR